MKYERKKEIEEVNRVVNYKMHYVRQDKNDTPQFGFALNKNPQGDCDDYVVLKAYLLKKDGVTPANMCMGCIEVGTATGEANHAVLLVKTTAQTGFWFWKKTRDVELALDLRSDVIYTTDEILEPILARRDIRWLI